MNQPRAIVSVLVGLHLLVLLAGFAAPYDPVEQARAFPYAPPTPLRFVDADGRFHIRPFVYGVVPDPNNFDGYVEDTTQRCARQLMVTGAADTRRPGIRSRRRVLGVGAPGRI